MGPRRRRSLPSPCRRRRTARRPARGPRWRTSSRRCRCSRPGHAQADHVGRVKAEAAVEDAKPRGCARHLERRAAGCLGRALTQDAELGSCELTWRIPGARKLDTYVLQRLGCCQIHADPAGAFADRIRRTARRVLVAARVEGAKIDMESIDRIVSSHTEQTTFQRFARACAACGAPVRQRPCGMPSRAAKRLDSVRPCQAVSRRCSASSARPVR